MRRIFRVNKKAETCICQKFPITSSSKVYEYTPLRHNYFSFTFNEYTPLRHNYFTFAFSYMKGCLFFVLLILQSGVQSQTLQEAFAALANVTDMQTYQELKKQNNYWEISLKYISITTDRTYMVSPNALEIYGGKIGDTFSYSLCDICSKYAWKIIDQSNKPLYKADFIYIKGDGKTMQQIDSIRNEILLKYQKGQSFGSLIYEYCPMAKYLNQPWFCEGVMLQPYEDSVKTHKPGEVFTVNLPELDNYLVVLKTKPDSLAIVSTIVQIRAIPRF